MPRVLRSATAVVALLLSLLLVPALAGAAPLSATVDGPFVHFSYPTNGPSPDTISFTSTTPVAVQVTDYNCASAQFTVADNGTNLGTTSTTPYVSQPSCASGVYAATCEAAFSNPAFSQATFALAPGTHTLSFVNTTNNGRGIGCVRVVSPTSLAVAPASGTYGGTASLSATLTANGVPLANAPVALTLNGAPAGTAQTDGNGVATLGIASLSGIDAGTYAGGVAATYVGDGTHLGSTGSNTLTIAKAPSTTTLTVPGGTVYDGTAKAATAQTTGLGGAVIANPAITYTPGSGAPVNAGSYTASANFAGNTNYLPSGDSQSFTIAKAPLTVTADNKTKVVGAANPPLTAAITGFVNSETASVLSGSPALSTTATATSPVGTYPITAAQGTLAAANYAFAFANGTLTVLYASAGTCVGSVGHTVLQPVNADGTSVFKQGSTVPVKFRVCDANGVSIGTPGVVTNFKLVQTTAGTTSTVVNEPVDSTTPDTTFRWDATAQQWIFNLNTKALVAGTTYTYRITLNDGSTIDFKFGLK